MSANCAEADKNRLLRSGAAEYLVKPIKSESLAQLRRLVPSKLARDSQASKPSPDGKPEQNGGVAPKQAVLCSSLLEAASQAGPAEHSTGSDLTGMEGPDNQGNVRTSSPPTQHIDKRSAAQAADGANASSGHDTSSSPSSLSPLQVTGGVSANPLLNVAVVMNMPTGMRPMVAEQVRPSPTALLLISLLSRAQLLNSTPLSVLTLKTLEISTDSICDWSQSYVRYGNSCALHPDIITIYCEYCASARLAHLGHSSVTCEQFFVYEMGL